MLSSFWLTRDTRWCLARPSVEKESPYHFSDNQPAFWIFRAPLFWSSAHASIIWKFRINPFYTITGNLRRKWRRLCTLKTFWKVSCCWSRKYQSVAGSLTIFKWNKFVYAGSDFGYRLPTWFKRVWSYLSKLLFTFKAMDHGLWGLWRRCMTCQ